jgi:hypothetical protein
VNAAFQQQGPFDRVIVFTDMQDHPNRSLYGDSVDVPRDVPVYVWDLMGYKVQNVPNAPGRYLFGGFSDAAFRMISLLERGQNADWPWV